VKLEVPDLAYAAALIDTLAVMKLREVGPTQLPELAINARYGEALAWLGDKTMTRISTIKRDYQRAGCGEHCPEAHVHIVSTSGRWVVTGVKATIVLHNVLPYLRVQRVQAIDLVVAGQTIGYKGNVVEVMRDLGWDIPPLKPQPRMKRS
jgi:hypothetical protein